MGDLRRPRWRILHLAVGSAALALGVSSMVAVPADAAGTAWAASAFEAPLDQGTATVTAASFNVGGDFRLEKGTPSDRITGAVVGISEDGTDDYELRDGCAIPAPVAFGGAPQSQESTDVLHFSIGGVSLNCNGTYVVQATAESSAASDNRYSMTSKVTVKVAPAPVTQLSISPDTASSTATIRWTPLDASETAIDAAGYVIQRAGPAVADGSYGDFADVGTVKQGASPKFVDALTVSGSYQYRVRALRDAPGGSTRSSILSTAVESTSFTAPTTTTTDKPQVGTGSRPRPGSGTTRPTSRPGSSFQVPTTIDTGYGETLDYSSITGDPPESIPGDPGEFGSVVFDEGTGNSGSARLLPPFAGALVMLGWATHFLYINRLAKRF